MARRMARDRRLLGLVHMGVGDRRRQGRLLDPLRLVLGRRVEAETRGRDPGIRTDSPTIVTIAGRGIETGGTDENETAATLTARGGGEVESTRTMGEHGQSE